MPHHPQRPTRRGFLGHAALVSLASTLRVDAQPPDAAGRAASPGLVVRQYQPDNLEMPFASLDRFITPNERFYVRTHFAVPNIDRSVWRLRVEGAVQRPLELSFEQIQQMPARSAPVLLECAGNSRVFLVPRPGGLLWELGGVGTAEWTGVPLAAILDQAGVRDGAVEVILEGADSGEVKGPPDPFQSPGRIAFARSLPLAKARRDVLLAYRMNGEELPAAHGYPLRAIVPSWYGMASIKWLARIRVSERPFTGYFQTMEYAYYQRQDGIPNLTPITELHVKSLIARPARDEVIAAQTPYRVHGAAWTGDSEIERVEVSTDGGRTWATARLLEQPVAHCWRLWEYNWQAPERGRHTLMSRATDRRGRTQPAQHDPDRRNSMISFTLPIPVEVR